MSSSITDVSFALPSIAEVISVMTLTAGFNAALVVLGTTILGLTAGLVGTFAVLRKRALMGDALAHSGLPGLCFAFIIFTYWLGYERTLPLLLLGAAVSGVLGILAVQGIVSSTRLTEDTAIGIILSTFFGLGVVLLSIIQSLGTGKEGGLHHFIYGQTAAMNYSDALTLGVTAVIGLVASLLFLKEFRLVSFDEAFAHSQGWPVSTIDLIMMSLIVMVTVVGFQSVGMILVVALLIIPAVSARFWSDKLNHVLFLSALFGALSGYFGSSLSALLPRFPAGSVIVLVAGVIFIISFLFAPSRGVIGALVREVRIRIRISEEHLLRELYEFIEQLGDLKRRDALFKEIRSLYGLSPISRSVLLIIGILKGFFKVDPLQKKLTLTDSGFQKGYEVTLTHRLWEQYLVTFAGVDIQHVDYSADRVEHYLSKEIVEQLKNKLSERKRLPKDLTKISSLHPLMVSND